MSNPQVSIIMGSDSDWPTMQAAATILDQFGILYEKRVVSAHRTPKAMSTVPVLGVPVASKHLSGQDSLYSIVQMPKGVPVATFAIGEAGAANAGLFAVAILANNDASLKAKLDEFRSTQSEKVLNTTLPE